MNTNNAAIYDYYTLDQARVLLNKQYEHDRLVRLNRKTRKQAEQKAEILSFIKQKLQGLSVAFLGVAAPLFLQGDATVSLIIVPMGLYIAFRKE